MPRAAHIQPFQVLWQDMCCRCDVFGKVVLLEELLDVAVDVAISVCEKACSEARVVALNGSSEAVSSDHDEVVDVNATRAVVKTGYVRLCHAHHVAHVAFYEAVQCACVASLCLADEAGFLLFSENGVFGNATKKSVE